MESEALDVEIYTQLATMFKSLLLSSLLVASGLCQKQQTQSLYGQCGGNNWTGAVACPTGAYCKNDGNEWYSQCVAVSGDSPSQPVGDSPITTKTRTSTISVDGPTPTVVTTLITYLTPVTTPKSTTTITLVPDEPYTPKWP